MRLRIMENKTTVRRRLKSTAYVIISQALLVALAISWVIHMSLIAAHGSVYFVENNPFILWAEIAGSVLIAVFAIVILATQIQRLGERRSSDMNENRR
jgi:membrane protein YdbS with pleckstrin-like domain